MVHSNGCWGFAQEPSPTIAQRLNGGYGWLEVKCHRCHTKASIPLNAIRRPPHHVDLEAGGVVEVSVMPQGPIHAGGPYDQVDGAAGDHAVSDGVHSDEDR
jgi:hypothetical protein